MEPDLAQALGPSQSGYQTLEIKGCGLLVQEADFALAQLVQACEPRQCVGKPGEELIDLAGAL